MPSNEALPRSDPGTVEVLVVGGSYAGLALITNLLDLCSARPARFSYRYEPPKGQLLGSVDVHFTLVDERDGYYHLIGQPLALASQGYAEKSWQEFKHIPALQTERVSVVQGSIASIDCKNKVASIETSNGSRQLRYDYFVAATGLRRGFPSAPKAVNKSDFLVETGKHIQKIQLGDHGVVVIGGGAVGIEMAAELKLVHPERKVTLIHSRSQLLSSEDLPSQYKDRVLSMLQSTGVDVVLESRVTNTTELGSGVHEVELSDGTRLQAAQVITAISKPSPTSSYLPASSLDDEGRVKITSRLRFQAELPNSEYHYAAGDIAAWSGINRAGGAMHQGHHVAVNIHQHIRSLRQGCEGQYMELQPVEPVICVAIGKEAACSCPLPGVETGAEVMKLFFEDDLGFELCWKYLQLGTPAISTSKATQETSNCRPQISVVRHVETEVAAA